VGQGRSESESRRAACRERRRPPTVKRVECGPGLVTRWSVKRMQPPGFWRIGGGRGVGVVEEVVLRTAGRGSIRQKSAARGGAVEDVKGRCSSKSRALGGTVTTEKKTSRIGGCRRWPAYQSSALRGPTSLDGGGGASRQSHENDVERSASFNRPRRH
jgi:hypothetical protein